MRNKENKGVAVVAPIGTKRNDYWVGSLEKVSLIGSWGSIRHPFVSIEVT